MDLVDLDRLLQRLHHRLPDDLQRKVGDRKLLDVGHVGTDKDLKVFSIRVKKKKETQDSRYLACVHLRPDRLVLQRLHAVAHVHVAVVQLADVVAHGDDELVAGDVAN